MATSLTVLEYYELITLLDSEHRPQPWTEREVAMINEIFEALSPETLATLPPIPSPILTTVSLNPLVQNIDHEHYDLINLQNSPPINFSSNFESPLPQSYNTDNQSLHGNGIQENNAAIASALDQDINTLSLYHTSTPTTWQEPDNTNLLLPTFPPLPSSADATPYISHNIPAQPGGIYDDAAVNDAIDGDVGDDSSEGFFEDDDDNDDGAQPSLDPLGILAPGTWSGASWSQPPPAPEVPPPMQDIEEGSQFAGQVDNDFWTSASSMDSTIALEALLSSPSSTEELLAILLPTMSPSPSPVSTATPTADAAPYSTVTFVVDSGAPKSRKRSRETEESSTASSSRVVEGPDEFHVPSGKPRAAIKQDKGKVRRQKPQQSATIPQVSNMKTYCAALFLLEGRVGKLHKCGLCRTVHKQAHVLRRHVEYVHGAKRLISWLIDGKEPLSTTELIPILHIAFASSLREARGSRGKEKSQGTWDPAWTAAEREAIDTFRNQFPGIDAPNVGDFEFTPLLRDPAKRWAEWIRRVSTCGVCGTHLSRPDARARHLRGKTCTNASQPEDPVPESSVEDVTSEYTGPPRKRVKRVHHS